MAYCYELERMYLCSEKGVDIVKYVRNYLICCIEAGLCGIEFDEAFNDILSVRKFPLLMLRAAIDYLAEIGDINIEYVYFDLKMISFSGIYGKKRR